MSQEAEDLLRLVVERAVEAENIPVPAIWKSRIVDLCVRVVHKLISTDRAVVAIAAEVWKSRAAVLSDAEREILSGLDIRANQADASADGYGVDSLAGPSAALIRRLLACEARGA